MNHQLSPQQIEDILDASAHVTLPVGRLHRDGRGDPSRADSRWMGSPALRRCRSHHVGAVRPSSSLSPRSHLATLISFASADALPAPMQTRLAQVASMLGVHLPNPDSTRRPSTDAAIDSQPTADVSPASHRTATTTEADPSEDAIGVEAPLNESARSQPSGGLAADEFGTSDDDGVKPPEPSGSSDDPEPSQDYDRDSDHDSDHDSEPRRSRPSKPHNGSGSDDEDHDRDDASDSATHQFTSSPMPSMAVRTT